MSSWRRGSRLASTFDVACSVEVRCGHFCGRVEGVGRVSKVYFTGMLTHGETDLYIQYIDPDSHTVRSYYRACVCQKDDGSVVIVEVKRDDKIETPIVHAKKDSADQIAAASRMSDQIIKGSEAMAGRYKQLPQSQGN